MNICASSSRILVLREHHLPQFILIPVLHRICYTVESSMSCLQMGALTATHQSYPALSRHHTRYSPHPSYPHLVATGLAPVALLAKFSLAERVKGHLRIHAKRNLLRLHEFQKSGLSLSTLCLGFLFSRSAFSSMLSRVAEDSSVMSCRS